MVGITNGQATSRWQTDISQAKSAGIDGFALNIGTDGWTSDQLALAFQAASAAGSFSLFLSFDMAASSWSVDEVVSYINTYKGASSQFKGPGWVDNWASVSSSTGGIFLVPDWSSLGPSGVASHLSSINGAFNWGAWPNANEKTLSTDTDTAYQSILQGKAYMMGISPYFYTDLPQYGKNWYSSSDSLWFDRWKQTLTLLPDYVELITWNDFGEFSYLNTPVAAQTVSGANTYVDGFDHSAFRFVLPYFIAAYKAGSTNVDLASEGAVAWYRTTPAAVCSDGSTVWGQGGSTSAASGTSDVISIIALSNSAGYITVDIRGSSQTARPSSSVGKASFYQVSFSGRNGAVTLTVNGKSTTGPETHNACASAGQVNFNAVAIQV
ncbi:glycoside hydrolase family 71 protein [Xylariales sp. AK1849]|nr:glycoside hydrolase family 71 protein [Xylariales sp. AK1849]